jgi:lipid-binding SYLF domain-containing protein
MRTRIALIAFFAIVPWLSQPALADSREEARLMTSAQVLQELMDSPDQGVPTWLLDRAYAVVVVPSVIKIGFLVGGRRGKGVLVVRREDGSWSNPVFINLTGGSFGFQAGVQSTDVLLVFTSKAGIEGIVGGKLTLGADASVAAGPVGRQTGAATDIGLNAQVYSYSRASGLFAGVALDGSALTIDHSSNGVFYSKPGILASEILASPSAVAPDAAHRYIAAVDHVTKTATASATPSASATTTTQGTVPATSSQPGTSDALTTYPMADPNPGAEPPK